MTAEYQEDVDGLTLGQCVDHPKWNPDWTVERPVGSSFRVWCEDGGDFVGDKCATAVEAARAALKTLLPPRPPVVVVTCGDRQLASEIWDVIDVPVDKHEFCDTAQKLIAAYRTKHAGAK